MTSMLDPATKQDLADQEVRLRSEIEGLGTTLRGEMADLRTELKGEMTDLRTELKGEMTGLRDEMTGLRGEMQGLHGEMQGLRDDMTTLRREVVLDIGQALNVAVEQLGKVVGVVDDKHEALRDAFDAHAGDRSMHRTPRSRTRH
jgi:predicted  nucleic acid-binding Zn-ribbon protein